MTYLFTAEKQRAVEQAAILAGMSEAQMMEAAGGRVFGFIRKSYELKNAVVPVLCGPGGNGGDGFVVARMLAQSGAKPLVVLCGNVPKDGSAAQLMYKRCVVEGVPVVDLAFETQRILGTFSGAKLIVDAVFGVGFRGALADDIKELFAAAMGSPAAIIALDLPSGVNSDTGFPADGALKADTTLSFVGYKPANVFKNAAAHCGRSALLDIGIPAEAYKAAAADLCLLNTEAVRPMLQPKDPLAHKGTAGRLLMLCGSASYRGAAVLAAKGALRAGAGLVTVASVESVLGAVAAHCPEAVLLGVEHEKPRLTEQLFATPACLFGCGLSRGEATRALLEQAIGIAGALVIDADGLNELATNLELIKQRNGPTILTPHPGEFARLCGLDIEAVLADRVALAAKFAKEHDVVVVLKSENTVVALPSGNAYVNALGNAGLAKAGSGDLLAGAIAAFAAMGKSAEAAAALGVYVHSAAADFAARDIDLYSMTASDVAARFSSAIATLWTDSD